MKPPITIMSMRDLPPHGLFCVRSSPCRAALAAEDDHWTWESLAEKAYTDLLASANRRGIVPRGIWSLLLSDTMQWRSELSPQVVTRIEQEMRSNPAIKIIGMAYLVDSEDMHVMDVPGQN